MTPNSQLTPICDQCIRSDYCIGKQAKERVNAVLRSHKNYQRGQSLFVMGDDFDALYILRSGSAKSVFNSAQGEEQILGFHYPGDILGMDGFDSQRHSHTIRFLETSSVCHVGLKEIEKDILSSPIQCKLLLKNMSHSLIEEQRLLLSASQYNSEQRIAKFLLDLSHRANQNGLSASTITLSMTRTDIANFLGMAIETISRIMTKLHEQRIINVDRRQITLLDFERLRQCVEYSQA